MNRIILSEEKQIVLIRRHHGAFHDLIEKACKEWLLSKAEGLEWKLNPGLRTILQEGNGGLMEAYYRGEFPDLKKRLERALQGRVDIYTLILCGDRLFMEALIRKIEEIDEAEAESISKCETENKVCEKDKRRRGSYGAFRGRRLLKLIFRYGYYRQSLSEENSRQDKEENQAKKWLFDMFDLLEVRVCPYCNRQYTLVLKAEGENEKLDKWIRPQYDHFFPKSLYPYLALSLFNLIPSCAICNQSKGNWDTLRKPVLYPYAEEFGEVHRFRLEIKDVETLWQRNRRERWKKEIPDLEPDEYGFKIHITYARGADGGSVDSKIENADRVFHLTDFYNEHRDYVRDVIRNQHLLGEDYLKAMKEKFKELDYSEIEQSVYMMDIGNDKLGRRPLARLTRDMDEELKSPDNDKYDYDALLCRKNEKSIEKN